MIVEDPPSYNADDPPRSWLAAFRAAGDPRRAEHEKRYLRSEIEHYGVPVPAVRRVVRAFTRHNPGLTRTELLAVARSLWATRVHECRLAAALLLEARTDLLASRDTAVLEELIRDSGTWALVDVLAGNAAGHLLLRLPVVESEYRRWAADEDQWVRRSGVLAFLQAVRQDAHVDRYLPVVTEIADPLLEDRQFFVRKAIGWVLREGGKRRPDLVFEWLRPRAGRVSGVTLREAVRYLPAGQRDQLLARR